MPRRLRGSRRTTAAGPLTSCAMRVTASRYTHRGADSTLPELERLLGVALR